ncbi:amidase [Zopfia rhizophila CBS 207.26]|uniref:amidase n=1 Tax=Zopfia rhizophila CBS 207.26 TaxID=1314779 RepID=A0A6A6D744_9PEZI|nr:amidase [Zopfia rhizophila CBS 207.26]
MSRSSRAASKRPWQDIAKEAQDHRDSTINQLSPPLPPVHSNLPSNITGIPRILLDSGTISITQLPPEELLQSLLSGRLSAVEVTTAYLRRSGLAQKLVNCITELLPDRALSRAKELDEYFQTHGKPIGPLHGLPISVKEHIGISGLRYTTGYVSFWGKIAQEDAHILQVLSRAGAIFHCRTTIPQTMMHLETDSNLYGITVNPYNSAVTSGGSSGGEGALIALRGSCLGIGSDVGGSIRSPAANCGVYGLKPTAFRIPTDGWGYMMAGADCVDSVLGPLSTSIEGLKIFVKTIIDAKPWLSEPALTPMPWRDIDVGGENGGRKLKIGVMWHDNVVLPHPPITRALQTVTSKLKENGVEVVDWEPYLHDEAWAIISSLYFTDGGASDSESINSSGEPWRPLSTWIMKENSCVKELSIGELNYWLEERESYRKEYAKVWNSTGSGFDENGDLIDVVDAILCPVGPGVAPKHNTAKYWFYTSQWNLLDYPAVSFPVMRVDKEVDVKPKRFKPMSGLDEENWNLYDPETFHGLPISLQLVCRRFEDEKVLGILEYMTELTGLPFESFDS